MKVIAAALFRSHIMQQLIWWMMDWILKFTSQIFVHRRRILPAPFELHCESSN